MSIHICIPICIYVNICLHVYTYIFFSSVGLGNNTCIRCFVSSDLRADSKCLCVRFSGLCTTGVGDEDADVCVYLQSTR